MVIETATAAVRRHKKDRSSIGTKSSDRASIGSKTLSFHQKKGRFAAGIGHSPRSDQLDRIRKNALEDFTRATHKRSQSVHQMAAMYASTSSDKSSNADGIKQQQQGDAWLPGGNTKGLGGLVSAFASDGGGRSLESVALEAQGELSEEEIPAIREEAGEEPQSLSPPPKLSERSLSQPNPEATNYSVFSSTSDVRARDLKKTHLDEARNLTSNRARKVKDIASGFKGESRPENVEVFHKRHKEQEADYRHKVHQGKETLKKTSQGTDAMYNFVLKLNLATTEGKERFMKKWAIGRIANGESINPREGWKFLKSLGIDVPKPRSPNAATDFARPGSPSEKDITTAQSAPNKQTTTGMITPAAASRGRGRTGNTPATAGGYGRPGGGGGGFAVGDAAKQESAAWEVAMSQAVGAVVKVDADACAPKLGLERRRRSGSEPRRTPSDLPRAPDTCRAPKTKPFFFYSGGGGGSDVKAAPPSPLPPAPMSDNGDCLLEQDEADDFGDGGSRGFSGAGLSLSPAGSVTGGLALNMKLWRQEGEGGDGVGGRRPQSQAFDSRGPSLDSLRASVSSSRMSLSPCRSLSPPRGGRAGVRISLNPRYESPGRFNLSPGRRSNGRSPLTPTAMADRSAAAALSAKVSWDATGPPPAPEGLQLPTRLFVGGGEENKGDGISCSGSEERFDGNPAEGFDMGGKEALLDAGWGESGGDAGKMVLEISRDDDDDNEGEEGGIRASFASSEFHEARGLSLVSRGFREDSGVSMASSDYEEAREVSLASPQETQAKAERLSAVSAIVGAGTLSDDEEEDDTEQEEKEEIKGDEDPAEEVGLTEEKQEEEEVGVKEKDENLKQEQEEVGVKEEENQDPEQEEEEEKVDTKVKGGEDLAEGVGVMEKDEDPEQEEEEVGAKEEDEGVNTSPSSSQACTASAAECPPTPEFAIAIAPDSATSEGEPNPQEQDGLSATVHIVADDEGSTSGAKEKDDAAEISAVMDDIARMDEQSILLDAETALMAISIDSGDDVAEAAGGGARSSLDDSGYAPDAEMNPPSLAGVDDDAPAGPARDADPQLAAERGSFDPASAGEEEGPSDVEGETATGDERRVLASPVASDHDDDDYGGGYVPSGGEDEEECGRRRGGESTGGVDAAVRETLDNLAAGVAILAGGDEEECDELLGCDEVLSELQSEDGDAGEGTVGDAAREDSAEEEGAASEDGGGEDEDPGVRGTKEAGGDGAGDVDAGGAVVEEHAPLAAKELAGESVRTGLHKRLKIAVGSELQEEEPPVPRLHWGVNHIAMDSPLTPSRYDDERAPSTSSLSPCRQEFTGLLLEKGSESAGSTGALTIEPGLLGNSSNGGANDSFEEETRVSSPWRGDPERLMSPLSPFSVDSSPDALEESELTKPNKLWGGRLSVLSEGGESRLSRESRGSVESNVTLVAGDDTAGPHEGRRTTGGTEEQTASPSSQRASTEPLPPPSSPAAASPAAVGATSSPAVGGDGTAVPQQDTAGSPTGREEEDGRGGGAGEKKQLVTPPSSSLEPRRAPEAAVETPLPGTPPVGGSSPQSKLNVSASTPTSSSPVESSVVADVLAEETLAMGSDVLAGGSTRLSEVAAKDGLVDEGGHYCCEEGDKGLAVESVESVPSGLVVGVVAEGGDCEEEEKGLADESVEAVPNGLVSEGGDCEEEEKGLAEDSVEAVPSGLVSEGGDYEETDKELAVESVEAVPSVSEGGDCEDEDKALAVASVEVVPSDGLVSEGGDCEEEDKGLAEKSVGAPEALRLDDMPNPYEDFDELHDRDYYTARTVQLDCKTPGDIFNFCRPRSGTVYQSASGSGPGFFSDADSGNVVGEAINNGSIVGKASCQQEDCGRRGAPADEPPKGGCTIS
ncbi:hypothetical protein Esi_0051_0072 [Ectocarpus siliculosus]|uniref:Uncharacterized protein n=1 Tax=Ectocarpus siliculosus TaxID=2880 RepID=D7G3I4_ECTSI|nr:hypothetical protein Esi_0051_0072 [Ectocarpus siliculosus]|eukprot:CBJ26982.1 hypothetical protein Esi_0051_0072 [Ectocarpus siliculosus]